MNISGNTILITGGASGIGLAFAERFLNRGNEVIIAGRSEEKLKAAKIKYPALHTRVCDVSNEANRRSLLNWITDQFPSLNVLINNAGIQQRINLLQAAKDWTDYRNEICIGMEGPIHLSMLFIPHLMKKDHAAIINVTSGLAIRPGAWVPIYSATKAALHSFTVSLRLQLAGTNIKVIEVFPPAVNTDLGGMGLHTAGAPLDDFADIVFRRFENGDLEIGYGDSEKRLRATKEEIDQGTKQAWESFLTHNPAF
ncbi:SDR family oxidoreductase [Marinicrinis lubricantis]|uniref:SDR family oxidoreductase n=1 Tax=Marinicrinis lubricantis TaxID=2086470 RepID=A0ABW1ILM1_9BACL